MSEIKEGYKKTKIGILPEEWDIKKAKDIFENYTNKNHDGELEVLAVTQDKGVVARNSLNIDIKSSEASIKTYKKVERGNFIISLRSFQGGIEHSEIEGIVSPAYTILRSKIDIVGEFYKYLFKKEDFISRLNGTIIGIRDGKQVSYTDFGELYLQVPPIKEQKEIAEILSNWDLAIEKQEQLIEKKKEFKKGLMQNLYSKGTKKEMLVKSKLGEVPESWKIVKAKEVFKSVSIKNNENEELLSVTQDKGTIPRSQLEGNVVMPEGSTRGYKLVVPNNFIISLRSFQGGLEISKHRGIISPAYTVLDNKIEICHDYFKYYFKKEEFISRLNGAIVGIRDGKQISYADFGEMFLPVPSLEEQIKIAEILMVADKEIELLEKELEVLKLQKKGLMQRLLTGEVRVKV